jgi:hypothetical protein
MNRQNYAPCHKWYPSLGESLPAEVGREGAAQDLATEKYETILVQYDVPEQKVTCNDRQKNIVAVFLFQQRLMGFPVKYSI